MHLRCGKDKVVLQHKVAAGVAVWVVGGEPKERAWIVGHMDGENRMNGVVYQITEGQFSRKVEVIVREHDVPSGE